MEEHFFFTNEGSRVFGVLHHPPEKSRKGLVFCHPFAEERQESHRVTATFADIVAENGFHVLRFDHRGTGDSEGGFSDQGFNGWIRDTVKAVETLKEKTGVEDIGLLGLRFGAVSAILTAKEVGGVKFLVLWAPILNIKTYLHQFLRGNLAFQMATYRKIRVTREELVNQLLEGKRVNVEGYDLSGKFYRQAIETEPLRNFPVSRYPSLIVQISRTQAQLNPLLQKLVDDSKHRKSEHCSIEEEPFWLEKRYYISRSEVLFDKTIEWIKSVG